MGLEKVVLKMFHPAIARRARSSAPIAEHKHRFFEGDTFHAVLRVVQAQPRRFKVYEKAGTLRISVQDVKDVHAAKEAMEGVVGSPVATDAKR